MEEKDNLNEFQVKFDKIFKGTNPSDELKKVREKSKENIEFSKEVVKFNNETSDELDKLKLVIFDVKIKEIENKVNEFTHSINIISKPTLGLAILFAVLVYLDGINIMVQLDKIIDKEFGGLHSLNFEFRYINLDLWSLIVTTLIMIGGTYYYTSKGFSKQLNYERTLRKLEQVKEEKRIVVRNMLYKSEEKYNKFKQLVNSLVNNRLFNEAVALSKSIDGDTDTLVVYRHKSEFNISEEPNLVATVSNIFETYNENTENGNNIGHILIESRKLMHNDQVLNFIENARENKVTILINNNYKRFFLNYLRNLNLTAECLLEVKGVLSSFETYVNYCSKRKILNENEGKRLYEELSLFKEVVKKWKIDIFDYEELENISMYLEKKSNIYVDVIDTFWDEDIVLYEISLTALELICSGIDSIEEVHKIKIRELKEELYSV